MNRRCARATVNRERDPRTPCPIEPKSKSTETYNLASRRAFLRLPIPERRKILAAQAEKMITHYEADPEWLELQNTEFVEYSH